MTEAVQRGVQLLDQKRAGWEFEIDIERLDLDSSSVCILGQLYGSYNAGAVALLSVLGGCCPYGFCGYVADATEWVSVIHARRAAAVQTTQLMDVAS